ncbi:MULTISPECIES: ABC transporter substrate-binding protein [unclassified Leifsonia]|uniref:ABC transporter substrate-binding protein n=1 Tax=unclassified Leifsonia TaxID=2663824 RepID=UPI0006FF18A6|nr:MULTISPECIES: extracellular solute-binding protein [unclassified Leifsonia]KQX08146.1 ABC transporter substrate-binding protein [Leifsonia sp. Root1293]KRA12427.1 ABC transporter substrate-binding protein [Leifsonia sp. Root60]
MNGTSRSTPFLKTSGVLKASGLILGLSVLVALTGCSSQQGATTLDEDAKVQIDMWTGQTDDAEKLIEKLADEFEQDHPNVTINVSPGASSTEDLLQKISAGFAGDKYPDISYAFGSWAGQLESSGRTLDITDQVSEPDVKWDEFSASARATAQPTGAKTIGFPAIADNLSLIYNKTVFDAAGVDYPTDSWTWDDFRAAAKKLTDEASNTYGYAYSVSGSEETTWQFWPHLWQNGGAILNEDDTKAEFASDAGVDALTYLRDMAVDDKSIYLDQTDTKFGELFASDRIGMITSGPWQLFDLKTAGTQYGVVPLPGTDGDQQTVSGADIWALFDHKDKNREYWSYEFIKWLTDAAQDERWNVEIGNLPLRSSEIDSAAFQKQVETYPGLDVMAANMVNAKQPRPTIPGYVGLSEAIGGAISDVLQGQGEPKQALEDAAAQADDALSE